jgi:hypothetical protein
MQRRFIDDRKLPHHLLDRHEGGRRRIVATPDYERFSSAPPRTPSPNRFPGDPIALYQSTPEEVHCLRFQTTPAYLLTIENFASFSRHVIEADKERLGATIYVGGYPALTTQRSVAQRLLPRMLATGREKAAGILSCEFGDRGTGRISAVGSRQDPGARALTLADLISRQTSQRRPSSPPSRARGSRLISVNVPTSLRFLRPSDQLFVAEAQPRWICSAKPSFGVIWVLGHPSDSCPQPVSSGRRLEIPPDLDCLNHGGMAIVRPRNRCAGPVAQLVRADRS